MRSPESISHIRRDLLDRPVREYADKLNAERHALLKEYGVQTPDEILHIGRNRNTMDFIRRYHDLTARLAELVRSGKLPEAAVPPEIREIMERERLLLNQFFGRDFDVPSPPPDVTPELLEFWADNHFTIRYLPKIEMGEKDMFPGWKNRPKNWVDMPFSWYNFYPGIKGGDLSTDAATLPDCWILIDERPKPDQRADTMQAYENDELIEDVLKRLEVGLYTHPPYHGSRFGRSWEYLHNENVLEAMNEALRLPIGRTVRLPRLIEWNFLADARYHQWWNTKTAEWLEDTIPEKSIFGQRRALYIGDVSANYGNIVAKIDSVRMGNNYRGFRWVAELR